jgi:hypothetical protein
MLGRIQNLIFILLFLVAMGMLGWLSQRHSAEFDLTWGKRNSLTEASVNIIKVLDKPVTVTAFVRDSNKAVHDIIQDLIKRYLHHKPDIELTFLNPDLVPQLVREHGITVDGEILVQYGSRQETLQNPDEKHLTQLLVKLAGSENSFVAFLNGHGERNLLGIANHDLGDFGKQLERKGFILSELNLIKDPVIPINTRVLVIGSPRTPYLEGEIKLIENYLDAGGNLLWLSEPGSNDGLSALAARLDIKRLPGQVVDATTRLFGIDDPTFALAVEYPKHAITETLHSQTLFPQTLGFAAADESDWLNQPILQTLDRSWTELDQIEGDIHYNEGTEERAGPITIGMALERSIRSESDPDNAVTQRVVVIGDGDFLSNSYLGNGQNLDLGSAIFQWLGHNDSLIDIGTVSAPDTQLQVSRSGAIGMLLAFLVVLPLGLLGTGIVIWFKRRRR